MVLVKLKQILPMLIEANQHAAKELACRFVHRRQELGIDDSNIEEHKIMADSLGKQALLDRLNSIDMHARVIVGEGEKDKAPGFLYDERIGKNVKELDSDIHFDTVKDQVEGTTRLIKGESGTMCAMIYAPYGTLLKVPGTYGLQAAVGEKAKGVLDLTKPISENAKEIAAAYGCRLSDLKFLIIDRSRSKPLIEELKNMGVADEQIDLYDSCSVEQTLRVKPERHYLIQGSDVGSGGLVALSQTGG